jgi:hypothetical protein
MMEIVLLHLSYPKKSKLRTKEFHTSEMNLTQERKVFLKHAYLLKIQIWLFEGEIHLREDVFQLLLLL